MIYVCLPCQLCFCQSCHLHFLVWAQGNPSAARGSTSSGPENGTPPVAATCTAPEGNGSGTQVSTDALQQPAAQQCSSATGLLDTEQHQQTAAAGGAEQCDIADDCQAQHPLDSRLIDVAPLQRCADQSRQQQAEVSPPDGSAVQQTQHHQTGKVQRKLWGFRKRQSLDLDTMKKSVKGAAGCGGVASEGTAGVAPSAYGCRVTNSLGPVPAADAATGAAADVPHVQQDAQGHSALGADSGSHRPASWHGAGNGDSLQGRQQDNDNGGFEQQVGHSPRLYTCMCTHA